MSTDDTPEAAPRTRSAHKRQSIVEAARLLFLEHGYVGASIDEISSAAGVSKPTLYRHFGDKERLFTAVVRAEVDAIGRPEPALIEALSDTTDLETALRDLAAAEVNRILAPRLVGLRRLMIAESRRFPALSELFIERGHERTGAALAAGLRRLQADGRLHVPDPALAAAYFGWLVTSAALERAMMFGEDRLPTPAERELFVAEAVRIFIAAYAA